MVVINNNRSIRRIIISKMLIIILLPLFTLFVIFSLINSHFINRLHDRNLESQNESIFKEIESEALLIFNNNKFYKQLYGSDEISNISVLEKLIRSDLESNKYITNFEINGDMSGSGVLTLEINPNLKIRYLLGTDKKIISINNNDGKNIIAPPISQFNLKKYSFISNRLGWIVTIYTPVRSFVVPSSIIYFIIILVICTVLSVIFIYVIDITFKEPFNTLLHITREIGSGNYNFIIPELKLTEIYHVAESFSIMADQIKTRENELHDYRLELEKMVDERTIELQETVERLKITQARLAESERIASLSTLVTGISHEFNTPLGVIITGVSFINDELVELKSFLESKTLTSARLIDFIDKTSEATHVVQTNSNRVSEIVKNFRTVAKDHESDEIRTFDLVNYITIISTSLKQQMQKKNIELDIKSIKEYEVETYPGAIYKVITNLLTNSFKFGFQNKANGRIVIEIFKVEDNIQIIYKDNGDGMNREVLNQIFEPFYTTNRGAGNSGLGMFIVYNQIAQNLQGSIVSFSKVLDGCEFHIIFPANLKA